MEIYVVNFCCVNDHAEFLGTLKIYNFVLDPENSSSLEHKISDTYKPGFNFTITHEKLTDLVI